MRGEKMCADGLRPRGPGSPPHARGKEPHVRHSGVVQMDHPRMRGEKWCFQGEKIVQPGSPPHARGKVFFRFPLLYDIGITPACAGKSGLGAFTLILSEDHPRMRGEKNGA